MEEMKTVDDVGLSTKPPVLSRLLMVFYRPSAVFPYLTSKIDWLIPLIIVAIIGGIVGHVVRPIYAREMYPTTLRNIEKFREQIGEARFQEIKNKVDEGFQEALRNPIKWYYPIIAIALPFVILAIVAALGLVTGNFGFGGKGSFWILFNVAAYASLIGLLGDVVRDALMILKNSMYIYTGLGLLKPTDDGSLLFYLFRQADIFSIWRIIVTAIGFGIVYKMKPRKFAYVIFGVWAVFIVLVSVANLFTGGSIVY